MKKEAVKKAVAKKVAVARTVEPSPSAAGATGDCLDENQALLLVTRSAGQDAERWRQHVDGCEGCRIFVAGLARVMVPDATASLGGWRDADGPLPAGTRLGKYVVGKILGRGGMGCVYAARDEDLGREVALKLLHVGGEGERAIARLRREAASMAALSHPNVAAVFDYGYAAPGAYVAMERVEGEDLQRWLQTPRSSAEILDAFVQAGRGLAAAHAAGVVHRDFKPSNAMMGSDGRVRVLDFGLALELDPRSLERTDDVTPLQTLADGASHSSAATHGGIAGTPAYAAPEQLAGARPTAAADQFAFCVALCEALVGERPFEARTLVERAALIAVQVWPAGLRQQPTSIARAIRRGLQPRPQHRFASMQALLNALSRPAPSGRVLRWGALAVAGGALVLGAVALSSRSEEPCDDGRQRMEQHWDAVRAQRWSADATVAAVVPRLDDAADAWLDARTTACAQRPADTALFEHRAVCLERAAARLGDTVDRIERGREEGSTLPSRPLAHLVSAGDCLDSRVVSPRRSTLADEFEVLNAKVFDVESQGRLAPEDLAPLRRETEALRVRAAEVGDVGLQAELTRKLGAFLVLEFRFEEAERYLQEAYLLATLADDHERQLELCETMVALFTQYLVEVDRAAYWATRGMAAADALGDDAAEARGLLLRGGTELAGGQLEAAIETYDEAEALVDPETFDRLDALVILRGEAKARLGRTAGATVDYERSLRLTEARLGPEHPALRSALNTLATVAIDGGDVAKGEALLRRAISLTPKRARMEIAFMRGNLGMLYSDAEDFERALETFEEVHDVLEDVLGSEHPQTLRTIVDIAETLHELGRDAEARALYDRLLAGKLSDLRSRALGGRAAARMSLGDMAGARADFDAVIALDASTDGQREAATEALAALDEPDTPVPTP